MPHSRVPRARRIRSVVVLITCGLLVLEWVGTDRAFRVETTSLATITENAIPSVRRLSEIDGLVARIRRELRSLGHADPARRAEASQAIGQACASIDHHLGADLALPTYPREPELQVRLVAALGRLQEAIAAVGTGAAPERLELHLQDALPAADSVHASLREIQFNDAEEGAHAVDAALEGHERARTLSLRFMLTCLALAAGMWFLVEREAARSEVEREARLSELDAFAARVAHDLKGPLSPMLLATAIVRRQEGLDERSRGALERLQTSIQRMGELIDGLLEFARAGAASDGHAVASLEAVMEAVVTAARPLAATAGAELRLELEPGLRVRASDVVLSSIAQNLVRNALLHLGPVERRVVTVGARRAGSTVRLDVADTGPGIPRDVLVRLFRPFERGSTSAPGHGLGLATVKRLAEAYGGTVAVETQVGAGSTFSVTLPAG